MAARTRPPVSLPLGPASITYRLTLEPVMVVAGGPRALLMQVTHPVVGAGVADHSDYETNPWNRLVRTLQAMTQLSLGSPERSASVSRMLRKSHATINGELEDGTPYRALDTENMRWVWATLLDSLVAVHAELIRPLSAAECRQLYEEWVLIAEACGVPRTACPADYDGFVDHVADVVDHQLRATTTARNVARMLERPPLPFPLGTLSSRILATLVPALLPGRLRDELGFEWSDEQQERWRRAAKRIRRANRAVPGRLRRAPGALGTAGITRLPIAPPPRRRTTTIAA